ncbi:galactose oxidase [Gigaspora margarita]|uniref:Galactose oxidase n=1 Tax=Gigaspora margarita TaxID=4874 RepID=A0A8H4EKJ1_GIGMA|nr:galactose oxidase [Gigaspora margarita]
MFFRLLLILFLSKELIIFQSLLVISSILVAAIIILEILTLNFFTWTFLKQFTITDDSSIPWVDLNYTNYPKNHRASACIGGTNNDEIFIFDGHCYDNYFIKKFDTNKQQWINITSTEYTSNILIFNTLSLSWSLSNASKNVPPPRHGYSAITLPNNNILYIGEQNGVNGTSKLYLPMNKNTTGPTPPIRESFSVVLSTSLNPTFDILNRYASKLYDVFNALDGRVILFGGVSNENFLGDLWILDVARFQWSKGNISNPISDLTLSRHTATLVGNYMFVVFGQHSTHNYSSRIFMLDISQNDSYRWVTEFTPLENVESVPVFALPTCVIYIIIILLVVLFSAIVIIKNRNYLMSLMRNNGRVSWAL